MGIKVKSPNRKSIWPRNIRLPLPPDVKKQLRKGVAVLERYHDFLSERGQQLAQQAEDFLTRAVQFTPEEIWNRSQELVRQLPRLAKPQLDLFRNPDSAILNEVRKRSITKIFVETNQGCENKCTFCQSEALPNTSFMPYFMFLQIVKAAKEIGGKINLNFSRSDPFQYRDVGYGAHFGNIYEAAQEAWHPESFIQSHGWPKNHRFALVAAEYLNQKGIRIDRLSIHFFHKKFVEGMASRKDYNLYAERFAQAINLLRPKYVRLCGIDQESEGNPLSLLFVRLFFKEKIFPLLLPDLQGLYKEEWDGNNGVFPEGVYYVKANQTQRLETSIKFKPYPLRATLLVGRFNIFPDGSFAFYNGNSNPSMRGYFVYESETHDFEMGKLY